MGRRRARQAARREHGAPAPASGKPRAPLMGAAIALLLVAAYANALGGGLVRDAAALILDDPRVRDLSAANLRLIWTGEYWWQKGAGPLYRPLATCSFLFGYVVHGERPLGYHAVNVALHGLNAMLVYGLMRHLSATAQVAGIAAAVFAVHPIATEAVTNVAGRADLLAAAGVLGALVFHMQGRGAGVFFCALAGLFAKENAIVVAPLVVLLDVIARRSEGQSWRWRSYVGITCAFGLWFVARRLALADVFDPGISFADNPLVGRPFTAARLTALNVLGQALFLLVWPRRLSADYSFAHFPLFPWHGRAEDLKVAAALAAIGVLLAAAIVFRRRRPPVAFLAGFLVVALLPTSNLLVIIGSVFAERFLYLPSVAFAGLLAFGIQALIEATPPGSMARRGAITFAAVVVVAFGLRTHARNRDWRDDEALFRAARDVVPRSYRAHKGLAQALLAGVPDDARLDEAISAAEEAVRILDARPPADRSADTLLLLGMAYMNRGDRAAAREPAAAVPWYRRAREVLERGAVTDRAQSRGAAIGLARLYDILGNVDMRLGDPKAALESFEYFRRLMPARSVGYMLSGWALGEQGRLDEASVATMQAWLLDQRPDSRTVLEGLYARRFTSAVPPFRADGTLDEDAAAVRDDLRRACADLIPRIAVGVRPSETARARARCHAVRPRP